MTKILRGASREAFADVASQWRGLLGASVLPFLVMAVFTWLQQLGAGPMFETIFAEAQNPDAALNAGLAADLAAASPRYYMLGLGVMLAYVWNYVRILRFWKKGQHEIYGVTAGEISATARTLAYGVAMLIITALAYVVLAMGAAALGTITLKGFGAANGQAMAATLGIAMILLLGIFLYRFLVGLPGIALGEKPNLFSDIWPLAQGESWGLPLRQCFWMIVGLVPVFIATSALYAPLLQQDFSEIAANTLPRLPQELISRVMASLSIIQVISLVLQVPVMWFGTVLSGIAHFRFRARLAQSLAK
jgi:hypothetical protein